MKTVVETFVIEETAELIYDDDKLTQWNELVEELNLEGQTKIVSEDKSPIPFMHLKQSLVNVFETLCPRKVLVEEYNVTPIPVEILELVALSKRENHFKKIEIWYDDKSPDPACIASTGYWAEISHYSDSNKLLEGKQYDSKQEVINAGGKHPSFYTAEKYLLGKWADVKHTFEELKKMATDRYVRQETNDLNKTIKTAQRKLDDIDTQAFDLFN